MALRVCGGFAPAVIKRRVEFEMLLQQSLIDGGFGAGWQF
jgi:hypothetical protein